MVYSPLLPEDMHLGGQFSFNIKTMNSIYLTIGELRIDSLYRTLMVKNEVQYIPRNMHTVLALLCFVVVIHWLIFPYQSSLLHWHCGNLTIAPVPAKQPWWIWINTSCEFIMNDCITTTKQSTKKQCAYFLGYTVTVVSERWLSLLGLMRCRIIWKP